MHCSFFFLKFMVLLLEKCKCFWPLFWGMFVRRRAPEIQSSAASWLLWDLWWYLEISILAILQSGHQPKMKTASLFSVFPHKVIPCTCSCEYTFHIHVPLPPSCPLCLCLCPSLPVLGIYFLTHKPKWEIKGSMELGHIKSRKLFKSTEIILIYLSI